MPALPPRKKRKVSPPDLRPGDISSSDSEAVPISAEDFTRQAAKWDLEQDYEQRPRKQKKLKENLRLPIKTAEGRVEHLKPPETEEIVSDLEDLSEDNEKENGAAQKEVQSEKPKLSQREQILQAKEELARLAGLINEAPDEHIGSLRRLAEITGSSIPTITKLGLATQLAVFKDIIPGYRIRPIAEQDMGSKLSKEVRMLRNFEQSIVKRYKEYVKELERIANLSNSSRSEDAISLASVAISCACSLLGAVPHFNFREDLLRILVRKLSKRQRDQDFVKCRKCLETLFADDDEGSASFEAVSMLSKMIKSGDYRIDQTILNTFLRLRVLTEFSKKGSSTGIDKDDGEDNKKSDKKAKNGQYRSKKQRKQDRENKAIAKEMQEADAIVSHEHRDEKQAETLKIVFSIYFRILKAKVPDLKGAVLEGLVKYSHLINQDFFGDIIESLRELMAEAEPIDEIEEGREDLDQDLKTDTDFRNLTRESLLCVITAFALLQGQEGASELNLDLNFFISQLYRTLYPAALDTDIERSSKSLHLPDPDSGSAQIPIVNVQTTVVLLIRSLNAVLLPTNIRNIPPVRLAAYAKQLMTMSMHIPEKSCRAILGLLNQVAKSHRKKIRALWYTEERRGDGVFDPLRAELEGSNPFAATIWEGELLRLHYSSDVRDAVKNLETAVADQ